MATQTVSTRQSENGHREMDWYMLPTHLDLPESDGTFVKNFQEHPQSVLLTTSAWPKLEQLHPDNRFAIGQDSGIYWRITDPLTRGAEAPDWFYVPNVDPMLDGTFRRSYVLWQELVAPLIVIEFVSGNGSEERDKTPLKGKFWVYEQVIRPPYYAIYEVKKSQVEVFQLIGGRYIKMLPNPYQRFPVPEMEMELGIWRGVYQNVFLPWLRWWDADGNLLMTGDERAEQERIRAEQEWSRAEQERIRAEQERSRAESAEESANLAQQRADRLAAQLRALGISPDL